MSPVLQVRGLSKTYASGEAASRALDDVTLDIHGGELTLLVGPSGSGKTTLLSIMGCILRASAGQLWLQGQEVQASEPLQLATSDCALEDSTSHTTNFGAPPSCGNTFPVMTPLAAS